MNDEINSLGIIIYNVTALVDKSIATEWLQWIKNEHIPQVMKTGCFINYKVVRLLETDESEGFTYAMQYTAQSKSDYNRYIEFFATDLRKQGTEKWGELVMAFRSVMEVVH